MTVRDLPIRPRSAFDDLGMAGVRDGLIAQTQALYLADSIPWVVGYSGGKDSTAVLQLVWQAIAGLEAHQRTKQIHVISTDTLVENPIVASWVTHSLEMMQSAADEQGLPIRSHRLTPTVADSFWVNLAAGATRHPGRSSAGAPSGSRSSHLTHSSPAWLSRTVKPSWSWERGRRRAPVVRTEWLRSNLVVSGTC